MEISNNECPVSAGNREGLRLPGHITIRIWADVIELTPNTSQPQFYAANGKKHL